MKSKLSTKFLDSFQSCSLDYNENEPNDQNYDFNKNLSGEECRFINFELLSTCNQGFIGKIYKKKITLCHNKTNKITC